MSIVGIKSAIQTAIKDKLRIECYTSIPDVLSSFPSVVIRSGPGNPLVNFPNSKVERTFYIDLILQKPGSTMDTQNELDTYIVPGAQSMVTTLLATDLTGNADWLRVVGDSGPVSMQYGDVNYLGCRWTIVIMI